MTIRRKSSLAAAKRIQVQVASDSEDAPPKIARKVVRKSSSARVVQTDASWTNDAPPSEEEEEAPRPTKRQKTTASSSRNGNGLSQLNERLFGASGKTNWSACAPPSRRHAVEYHRPLLLDGTQSKASRDALLKWFDGVSASRQMPWRKPWINPRDYADSPNELRSALERRAYEVWISEIMLQQTRVAVVIDYWNRWVAKWPTVRDLAGADEQDVLAAWRGLGYYSRATRIHAAARKVVADEKMKGLLPETAEELEANVPGVGRYTGGAISAIVFGHAAPMVDGNVLRVLSRQLGILGNVKTDKVVISTLWAAADALVKAVAEDASGEAGKQSRSDAPGRWGQGLMELGSTICTPKPNCSACPITSTCRAYGEGMLLATKTRSGYMGDIEELCNLCEPAEEVEVAPDAADENEIGDVSETKARKSRGTKQSTLSSFFGQSGATSRASTPSKPGLSAKNLEVVVEHARKFPLKVVKKAVREEETLVCAIRRSDGCFLIQRRPEKGLLAGLWELPSYILPATNDSTPKSRKKIALEFASKLLSGAADSGSGGKGQLKPSLKLRHIGELGSVPWLFSHIKLTMHAQFFVLETETNSEIFDIDGRASRWATSEDIEQETMGTGMRQCWALAKEAEP